MRFKDFLHLRGACGLSGYGIISICFICLCSLLSQASYFGLLRLQWRISEVGGAKIVKTLIIPYFLYQFIYLPILFVSKYGYSDISVLWKLLCGLFLGDGYWIDSKGGYYGHTDVGFMRNIYYGGVFFTAIP